MFPFCLPAKQQQKNPFILLSSFRKLPIYAMIKKTNGKDTKLIFNQGGSIMSVNGVSNNTHNYYSAANSTNKNQNTASAKDTASDTGVIYEKSEEAKTYDKEKVVAMLKADAEQRVNQFRSMVQDMMKQQGKHIGTSDDSMWRFLAGGNFTVTAEAKSQAQAAISEDGYWGVKQTSDRIVEFAKALSGGDPEKADELFKAFEKGFKQATKSWGKTLPDISHDTYDAVKEKFDAWKNEAAAE